MSTKKKKQGQAFPRLATKDGLLVEQSSARSSVQAPRARRPKVLRKRLNRLDARVGPLFPRDLLDTPLGKPGFSCDSWPLAFALLQLVDDIAMDGFRHIAEDKPAFGFMQPENGRDISLRSLVMALGRPQKVVTPKDIIGQILIDNIVSRWYRAFPTANSDKDRLEALAKRSGVGKETLRKMMKGEQSPRIDTVDRVARALGTTADVLLRVARAEEAAA